MVVMLLNIYPLSSASHLGQTHRLSEERVNVLKTFLAIVSFPSLTSPAIRKLEQEVEAGLK